MNLMELSLVGFDELNATIQMNIVPVEGRSAMLKESLPLRRLTYAI